MLLLLTELQAANITIPENVTIFAPTNAAFASSSIKDKTGLSAADLLLPANKDILVKVRAAASMTGVSLSLLLTLYSCTSA